MMPRQSSCRPPTKRMRQAREGQPDTGSPKRSVFIIITMSAMKATRHITMPLIEAMESGFVENAKMPSRE